MPERPAIWRRWADVVQRPEGEVDLGRAALLISASADPTLDVGSQLARLDRIAARVGRPDTAAVCDLLFEEMRLRGDDRTYGDPANSYLDRVLDRGVGIPISLSVLLLEVGARCGVRLEGVSMPGHFLVRDPADPGQLIDPFAGGRRIGRPECERLMRLTTGSPVALTDGMLEAAGSHSILARMLANLDRIFEERADGRSLVWVSELRRRLPGAPVGDRIQLASRLSALGHFGAAADVLDDTAGRLAGGPARDRITARALTLRARLN